MEKYYKVKTVKSGDGIMVYGGEIHGVDFLEKSLILAILFAPVDGDLPEENVTQIMETEDGKKINTQGIYSDSTIKILKVNSPAKAIMPKHSHPGKEWLHVLKGKFKIKYYRGNDILVLTLMILLTIFKLNGGF